MSPDPTSPPVSFPPPTEPAHDNFAGSWSPSKTAALSPSRLPISKPHRAWERKAEEPKVNDARYKRVWRRYELRREAGNQEGEGESHDEERAQIHRMAQKGNAASKRSVKRLRTGETVQLSQVEGKVRYKATKWDRRKSPRLHKRNVSIDQSTMNGSQRNQAEAATTYEDGMGSDDAELESLPASSNGMPSEEHGADTADEAEKSPALEQEHNVEAVGRRSHAAKIAGNVEQDSPISHIETKPESERLVDTTMKFSPTTKVDVLHLATPDLPASLHRDSDMTESAPYDNFGPSQPHNNIQEQCQTATTGMTPTESDGHNLEALYPKIVSESDELEQDERPQRHSASVVDQVLPSTKAGNLQCADDDATRNAQEDTQMSPVPSATENQTDRNSDEAAALRSPPSILITSPEQNHDSIATEPYFASDESRNATRTSPRKRRSPSKSPLRSIQKSPRRFPPKMAGRSSPSPNPSINPPMLFTAHVTEDLNMSEDEEMDNALNNIILSARSSPVKQQTPATKRAPQFDFTFSPVPMTSSKAADESLHSDDADSTMEMDEAVESDEPVVASSPSAGPRREATEEISNTMEVATPVKGSTVASLSEENNTAAEASSKMRPSTPTRPGILRRSSIPRPNQELLSMQQSFEVNEEPLADPEDVQEEELEAEPTEEGNVSIGHGEIPDSDSIPQSAPDSDVTETIEEEDPVEAQLVSEMHSSHFDLDTEILKDFLSRNEKKSRSNTIAKRTSLNHRRDSDAIRQALASPRKVLEDKDPNSPASPSKHYDAFDEPTLSLSSSFRAILFPEAATLANVKKQKASVYTDSKDEDGDEAISPPRPASRRSTRSTRSRIPSSNANASSGLPTPNKIPVVHRAGGTGEPVVLKRTEAQEMALLTRNNTRRNKMGSVNVRQMLSTVLMDQRPGPNLEGIELVEDATTTEAGSDEAAVGADVKQLGRLRWAETLCAYQEAAVVPAKASEERALRRPSAARDAETSKIPSAPTSAAGDASSSKKKTAAPTTTPRARKQRTLGASNGTPAKGLLAGAASLLPDAVVAEDVAGNGKSAISTSPAKAKPQQPAVAKERKSRIATPKAGASKLKLPVPQSSSTTSSALSAAASATALPSNDGKENRLGMASPPKKMVLPPSQKGMEAGLATASPRKGRGRGKKLV
ncbi:hypothetical protein K402DRAFT_459017 [Aulographum hederae CBS 113979]|uniref:Uncharacterized protein n=1 Tax=Aulographum hederae CBS 113979 TaxID=1176131 RepID=A0A6G1HET8_9PEZI|nr:hypothetical protein K402DRAFT_459017 [Aulographum hederae CBS 113979]